MTETCPAEFQFGDTRVSDCPVLECWLPTGHAGTLHYDEPHNLEWRERADIQPPGQPAGATPRTN